MADNKPQVPSAVAEVLDDTPAAAPARSNKKVDFSADERRIATAKADVPGAGGVKITDKRKVKLANGITIENF